VRTPEGKLALERPVASTETSAGSITPSTVRHSILIVDDEANLRALLHWFLTQQGYDVATAASADKALALVDGHAFDVALLDIKLGTIDGINLLERLIQRLPELKAIMMTAYPTARSMKQAFDKGAIRFLTKPLDLPALAAAIARPF